jgi:D-alanyl-D-alanine carboxypeptidase
MFLTCVLGFAGNSATAEASIRHHHGGRVVIARGGLTDPEKDAALVLDGATGRVLYARNEEAIRHPASLTKMMTLYLLFEQLKNGQMTLATPLPVSAHAAAQHRTKLYLRPGTSIPVEQAIRAIVVCSANDVAVAISEAIGGSESHFAELMTEKARALGMTHTFYHNASGLPDALQVTTASDLSILARHLAYDFPQYFPYFSTQSFLWHGELHQTTDHLIGAYEGADGIKTGYTGASGFNLVSSVVRGGAHVIGVVMGGVTARRRDAEMMHLLDSTFAQLSQNPSLVARNPIPWRDVAQNAQTNPVIAGFQIGSAGAMFRPRADETAAAPTAPASDDAEDEAAAESRPDPESAPANPPAATASTAPAPVTQTPPQPVRTASAPVAQTSPPVVHAPPARVAMMIPPPALRSIAPRPESVQTPPPAPQAVALVKAHPLPRPHARPVVLAAFHPQPAVPIFPRPRSSVIERSMIASANAGVSPRVLASQGPHQWMIQIGAFADASAAKAQLSAYAERSMDVLGQASRAVVAFQSTDGHLLYRARFGPFAEREAREVCSRLTERGQTCFAALAER